MCRNHKQVSQNTWRSHVSGRVDRRCLNRVTSGLRLLITPQNRLIQLSCTRLKSMVLSCTPQKIRAARQLRFAALSILGSPTWARTRDLRINSMEVFYTIGIDRHIRNQQIAERIHQNHASLQLTGLIHIYRCAIIWVTSGLPVGYGLRVSPGYDWVTSFREDHHG